MRLLICGSRHWRDPLPIRNAIVDHLPDVVIHGACSTLHTVKLGPGNWKHEMWGADYLAGVEARDLGIPVLEFPADWERLGPVAGPIRNERMLDEGRPDLVIAFAQLESRGTWDMVRKAQAAHVPVIVVKDY